MSHRNPGQHPHLILSPSLLYQDAPATSLPWPCCPCKRFAHVEGIFASVLPSPASGGLFLQLLHGAGCCCVKPERCLKSGRGLCWGPTASWRCLLEPLEVFSMLSRLSMSSVLGRLRQLLPVRAAGFELLRASEGRAVVGTGLQKTSS